MLCASNQAPGCILPHARGCEGRCSAPATRHQGAFCCMLEAARGDALREQPGTRVHFAPGGVRVGMLLTAANNMAGSIARKASANHTCQPLCTG
eukprot:361893-Chlamydomonas_euryale.AAC.2